MGGIFSGISAILSGGITGLLGIVLQRFADYKNKQLDMQLEKQRGELELNKMDKEAAIAAQEWAARTNITTIETEGKKDVADSEAFAKSYDYGNIAMVSATNITPTTGQQWLLIAAEVLRNIVRPGLTVYLCIIATKLYVDAHTILSGQGMDSEQATLIVTGIIDTILYLWVTCTTWWFGTRNKQPAPKGLR